MRTALKALVVFVIFWVMINAVSGGLMAIAGTDPIASLIKTGDGDIWSGLVIVLSHELLLTAAAGLMLVVLIPLISWLAND